MRGDLFPSSDDSLGHALCPAFLQTARQARLSFGESSNCLRDLGADDAGVYTLSHNVLFGTPTFHSGNQSWTIHPIVLTLPPSRPKQAHRFCVKLTNSARAARHPNAARLMRPS